MVGDLPLVVEKPAAPPVEPSSNPEQLVEQPLEEQAPQKQQPMKRIGRPPKKAAEPPTMIINAANGKIIRSDGKKATRWDYYRSDPETLSRGPLGALAVEMRLE